MPTISASRAAPMFEEWDAAELDIEGSLPRHLLGERAFCWPC